MITKHFGSDESPAIAAPVSTDSPITVSEVILRYWRERVEKRYQDDGKPTDRQAHIRLALAPLRKLFGRTLATEFGPRKLKAVRDEIVSSGHRRRGGLNRRYVNDHIGIIKRMFRWAVSEELLPLERGAALCQALAAVENLYKGEDSRVTEGTKVHSVPDEVVERTLPFMSSQIRTMVQVLQLTGMRPDEVTIMKPASITRRKEIWLYRPSRHKLDHKDIDRVVPLGPGAQKLLLPWLDRGPDAFLFSPREVVAAMQKQHRKRTKKSSSNKRQPREHYDDKTFCRAVKRACARGGVPKWTPGQLRHTVATRIKNEFDRETARQLLGHGSASTTEIYVDEEITQAIEAMKVVG